MSETVIVALGSNLGDRKASLARAKEFLTTLAVSQLRASSIYRSDPLGPARHEFLNAVVAFETVLKPEELLTQFKSFEWQSGRDPKAPRWSDRPIDLDIIAYGSHSLSTTELQLPHPEYTGRLFVLLPLAELYPDWTDPLTGKSIGQMIEEAAQIGITKTNMEW